MENPLIRWYRDSPLLENLNAQFVGGYGNSHNREINCKLQLITFYMLNNQFAA
jgi:hypothetical protein